MTFYVDYDNQKLVVSSTAATRFGTGGVHENDVGPFTIVILQATGNTGSPYTISALPAGFDTIAVGARSTADLPAALLFTVTAFAETGSGDTLCYVSTLDLTSDTIHALFPDDNTTKLNEPVVLDIQFSASDGSVRETVVKQWPFVIERDIYDADPATSPPARTALITVPYCRHDITALTGGGAGKLDGIATAAGAALTNLTLMIFIAGVGMEIWRLEASDATAEDGVNVVDPDDFNLSTNNRKWYRRS